VEALGEEAPLVGRVVEIATSGRKDPSQGTIRFLVKIALDDPHPKLRPAMTAKVDILTATAEDALAIPVQAVVRRTLDEDGAEVRGAAAKGLDESNVVYVISDGEASVRRVTTGVTDVLWVEISEGLGEGDEVITGPYRILKKLKDGDPVHVGDRSGDEESGDDEASGEVEVTVD
jgi:HlyD family secretion protein